MFMVGKCFSIEGLVLQGIYFQGTIGKKSEPKNAEQRGQHRKQNTHTHCPPRQLEITRQQVKIQTGAEEMTEVEMIPINFQINKKFPEKSDQQVL